MIRSASIMISDWSVGKQLKTISQKRRKKMTLHVDLGPLKQIHIYFVSPKWKIWFWRPKSISPYGNFLNWSTERKKSPDLDNFSYFINLNKFWRKKKNRAWLVRCTKTIRKPNSSNFHNPSTSIGLKQIHKTYI